MRKAWKSGVSPPSINRNRQRPLLSDKPAAEEQNKANVVSGSAVRREKSKRMGEVAGGTAAGCAAIICCPCGVVHMLILAAYKLPAGLCRKMWRKRKLRQKKRNGLLEPGSNTGSASCNDCDAEMIQGAPTVAVDLNDEIWWRRFHGTGFWRSASQMEKDPRVFKS